MRGDEMRSDQMSGVWT